MRLPVTSVAPRWQPPIHCGAPDKRIFRAPDKRIYSAQLADVKLVEGPLEIAFGASASRTPFQGRWVVSWPAATEPSLAVKSIVW